MPAPDRLSVRQPKTAGYALQVNSYDRASSILVASLIITTAIVVGLMIIFFTSRVVTVTPAIPVTAINEGPGETDAPSGVENPDTPGVEDAPEELTQEIVQTLNVMDGLVAAQLALIDDESIDDPSTTTKGNSTGDRRGTSDGGGPGEPTRQLRFQPDSFAQYAEWLDSAGMEIGVLGEDNRVYYASGLSTPNPTVREGDPADEARLYFNTRGGPLEPLDQRLVAKAGIAGRGSIVLLFCGPETQQRLLQLEIEKAGGRPIEEIKLTVFRVLPNNGAFELIVEEQNYTL